MKLKIRNLSYYFILPVFLFIVGTTNLVNYLKTSEFGVLNLDVRGNLDQIVSTRFGELLKGDIVSGKFYSSYPNLGIVSMRFYNQNRDSDDTLAFRIKEEGQEQWYYEAKYKTDQFLPHKLFPFGFPVINDSNGKNYVFQIESLRGATGSGILIDSQPPVFLAKSTYQKADLVNDKRLLLYFLSNKLLNISGDQDILLNNILFFLPLVYYVIFILSKGIGFQFLTSLALVVVFYDIFWLKESYDWLFISQLFFWGLISHRFRFESRITAILALGFLIMTPIMLIFNQDTLAEKAAVWAYLFLCVTVIQQIYELKKRPKNLLNLEKLRKNIFKFKLDQSNKVARLIYLTHKPIIILFTIYLLFWSGQKVYETSRIYQLFFPMDYFAKYMTGIIFPHTILLSGFVFIILKLKKHLNTQLFLALFLSLLFYSSSAKMITKSTVFKNYPTIFFVAPNNVIEAWADITIYGQNFGDKPFGGKVLIGGKEQRIIDWADTKIIFRTDPNTLKSGMLEVVTNRSGTSNKYRFNYLFK